MLSEALTVADLFRVKIRRLIYMPLGKEGTFGATQQGVITLDPRRQSPLARTLLHELIHVKRPLLSEWRVVLEERRLWKAATWQQKAELYRLLGKGQVWAGEQDFDDEEENAQKTNAVSGERGNIPL